MLDLNLISKSLKQEIKLKRAYCLLEKISLIFVFTSLFIGAILMIANFILSSNYNEISAQSNLTSVDNQSHNLKVKEINEKLSTVSQIQNEFVSYSQLFKMITEKIPEGISINYLKIDREKQQIKIQGRAEERDDLLKLKEEMEKLPLLSDINLPIKNMLEKTNINFEIILNFDFSKINNQK